jgi:hypothetical protein
MREEPVAPHSVRASHLEDPRRTGALPQVARAGLPEIRLGRASCQQALQPSGVCDRNIPTHRVPSFASLNRRARLVVIERTAE